MVSAALFVPYDMTDGDCARRLVVARLVGITPSTVGEPLDSILGNSALVSGGYERLA